MKVYDIKKENKIYNLVVDNIPEVHFQAYGDDYIGFGKENDNIIIGEYWRYWKSNYSKSLGGAIISIKMIDGTIKILQNNWWNIGTFTWNGMKFVEVGLATKQEYNKNGVFCTYYMEKTFLQTLLSTIKKI